ncbi:aldehyde dehydrogenase [Bacillus coahuilensis]|uniref:aldehyde dehydrogenase n=1 Tax=Bacillus coahuilensis TaxID=408580 RepID=UPI0009EC99F3|nr:aldehyde dehydrogenase [Bacillus coahuilensis]
MTQLIIEEKSHDFVEQARLTQKKYFQTGSTKPIETRIETLEKLKDLIKRNEQQLLDALKQDLHKSNQEGYLTEIGIIYEEIKFTLQHLKDWAKPKKVKTPFTHFGSKGYKIAEPYGVTLIIAPWNYPFQLTVSPLIGSIAAGNTAIIKPSELTPSVSHVMAEMINNHFDPAYLYVIEGGIETNQHLLKEPFDYIFFTGSVPVGKIVMEAASKHLTPVTLELGGKSPCIVHKDADLKLAAKRVAFGKLTNAGQTCIAPDYLFIHSSIKDEFLGEYSRVVEEFYGQDPLNSEKYGKIVNEKHFNRLTSYLDNGEIIFGGKTDKANHRIEPTLLVPSNRETPVMQEEIFGPIFPVLNYDELDEVIEHVNSRPKPLALYLFTQSEQVEENIVGNISYGGGCINDTIMHIATPYLPFGGVGESGIGSYHGESSFSTFSHYKSVLKQTNRFDFSFRYPSAKNGFKIIKKLLG